MEGSGGILRSVLVLTVSLALGVSGAPAASSLGESLPVVITGQGTFLRQATNVTPRVDLTISSTTGGVVVGPGEGLFQYELGEQVLLYAVPESGYRFTHWSGDYFATTNPTILTMDGGYTILANFEAFDPVREERMGRSLGELTFTGCAEELTNNTVLYPDTSEYDRPHVLCIEGLSPDLTGLIRMQNLTDRDPASPTYGQVVHARVKGAFAPCEAEHVLVRFSYLFESPAPGLELVVYLSDVPDLLDHDDPRWAAHHIEHGRVPIPPTPRPGSIGSGRFGVFEAMGPVGPLNVGGGLWVEVELVEHPPAVAPISLSGASMRVASAGDNGGGCLLDDLAVEVHCSGICLDLDGSNVPDEEDFLLVIAHCGNEAGLLEGGGSRYCLDGAFSSDGYVDVQDIPSWDWALGNPSKVVSNFCRMPLPLTEGQAMATQSTPASSLALEGGLTALGFADLPGQLLVLGKRGEGSAVADVVEDCLCLFERDRRYLGEHSEAGLPTRGNVRVVRGPDGRVYLINSEQGVLRFDSPITQVIPPGKTACESDPRFEGPATVFIGIQESSSTVFGRPVLDVAFDAQGDAYVVPVVVLPSGEAPYLAAARLELQPGANPPYELVQLYDDPPPAGDNQRRNHLREIEVDVAGNVYVVNAHRLNESCILWQYTSDGQLRQRINLTAPGTAPQVADPLGMYVSNSHEMLFLTSGQCDPNNPYTSAIYGFSTQDFSAVRSILIQDMDHATGITEDPSTGALWVVGFCNYALGEYTPRWAEIPADVDIVEAAEIGDPSRYSVALPTAITWIGGTE